MGMLSQVRLQTLYIVLGDVLGDIYTNRRSIFVHAVPVKAHLK